LEINTLRIILQQRQVHHQSSWLPLARENQVRVGVTLTKAEEQLNHPIHATHVQVEVGFGQAEAPFKALQGLWKEDDEQLTALVYATTWLSSW